MGRLPSGESRSHGDDGWVQLPNGRHEVRSAIMLEILKCEAEYRDGHGRIQFGTAG